MESNGKEVLGLADNSAARLLGVDGVYEICVDGVSHDVLQTVGG